MRFAFSEDQLDLKKGARRFLEAQADSAAMRRYAESDSGYNAELWKRVCEELCWPGLVIPEEFGGFGFGWVEVTALLEEMGRRLFCSPFFSTVCLGANTILELGSDAQKSALLPNIAAGASLCTLAWRGQTHRGGAEVEALRHGDAWTLNGAAHYVVDGHIANTFLVLARDGQSMSVFVVPSDVSGLTVEVLATMDPTRRMAALCLVDVAVDESMRMPCSDEQMQRILDRAGVCLSAELLGVADQCLEMSVEYAQTRKQFGRAIGSFQAIKHKCANMMMYVESARSAAYYAGWAAAAGADDFTEAAISAQSYAIDIAFKCAAEAIQIHGGIGITWEHDVHFYFKRAQAAGHLFGDVAFQRERMASLML